MTSPVRALWNTPAAVPVPPARVWRDWVLVGVLAPLIVVEAALRPEVPARWVWAVTLAALLPTLLWRRARPFTMLATAFALSSIVGLVVGGDPQLFTAAYFLILLYAAMRWGSGRAMAGAGVVVVVGWFVSLLGPTTSGDVIGSVAVVVSISSIAVALRWRAATRARELDRVRLLEREQLARELHDTVAHHVSAIAIQAQAGTVLAAADPDAATQALRVIEDEAARTLSEMRSMVRVLRESDEAAQEPAPGIADLDRLAAAGPPAVRVTVTGDVGALPSPIGAAVFRIAQEAVTNARRHARHATLVDVTVRLDPDRVRLDVRDDGETTASARPGFGITGMLERATMLGGSCTAGPAPGGGWLVAAELPATGAGS
ncbi:sensor histidine kinase [Microbacterium sp. CPCC 204701]|uniref:sensor histidine kinase n=1 Tax=Microbacterium sp. CPCC 204701 TaxID=2493084 RepID=UPI000FD812D6|nr:histidine kinase [Microbacterium sp. CPCC 204701]